MVAGGGGSVHPRARGEQAAVAGLAGLAGGSSPRTRGTAAGLCHAHRLRRFIPAHAGNRGRVVTWNCTHAVHPRARGEQLSCASCVISRPGSSPRTRGTAKQTWLSLYNMRFIPAHAGNRHNCGRSTGSTTVHPRARGEQTRSHHGPTTLGGSSPRTRGTAGRAGFRWCRRRFIPAHAGNRAPWPWPWPRTSVHPRARGEQVGQAAHGEKNPGSSPRTRGTAQLIRRADH